MLCNNHVKSHGACAHGMHVTKTLQAHVCGPQAIRVFNVWRRARILAARIVGENTSGVFYAHLTCALPECWRQSDCRIINITCYKNVISMKRSARRQKMYVLYATLYHRYCRYCTVPYNIYGCMHAVLTWLTDPWLTPKLESARQVMPPKPSDTASCDQTKSWQ